MSICIAVIVEPFLKQYQTNKPMVPFLHKDLSSCLYSLLARFIKREVLSAADTSAKMMKIDLKLSENLCSYKEIDIGVAASAQLLSSKVSDRARLEFRMECRQFLSAMCSKIIERSPLKFKLVKYASSVDPASVVKGGTVDEQNFAGVVDILFSSNNIAAKVADAAKNEYRELCSLAASKELKPSFETFNVSATCRLDEFYFKLLDHQHDYANVWQVFKMILVLSHGNAAVESGFSVNGDMVIENLAESSLVAQRMVYDSVKYAGGVSEVTIDKSMLQYVRGARSRYEQALQDAKAAEVADIAESARKRKIATEIKHLQAKKTKLANEAASAVKSIDEEIKELKKQT